MAAAKATPAVSAAVPPTYSPGPVRYLQGNFTGTGKQSVASLMPDGSIWVGTYNGSQVVFNQWFNLPAWAGVFAPSSPGRFFVGDFNGDGKDDIMFAWPDGTVWVGASTGSSFNFSPWANIPGWGPIWNAASPARTFVADFTGSGKASFAFTWVDGSVWVGVSTGSAFQFRNFAYIPAWASVLPATSPGRFFAADFTGDGKADLGFTWPDGTVWVGVSNGSTFQFSVFANIPGWGPIWNAASPGRLYAADFNGDGKKDLMFTWPDGSWWVGVSTGAAFTFQRWASIPGWGSVIQGGSAAQSYTADFNGDGKSDFLFTWPYDGSWWVGTASATAFTFAPWLINAGYGPTVAPGGGANVFVGDFNGDKRADFLARDRVGNLSFTQSQGAKFSPIAAVGTWLIGTGNAQARCANLVSSYKAGNGNGVSAVAIPDAIINGLVGGLYSGILRRGADPAGLAYFHNYVAQSGYPGLVEAAAVLASSAEFATKICPFSSSDDQASQFYQGILKRAADAGGGAAASAAIEQGQSAQVARNLVASAEYFSLQIAPFLPVPTPTPTPVPTPSPTPLPCTSPAGCSDPEGYNACIKKGYQTSACVLGTSTDTSGYAACINAGYQPASCNPNGGRGYAACIVKGYQPSSCASGTVCDTSGYAACVNAGYQPSACDPNGGAAYGVCIQAGYQPSSCSNAVPQVTSCDLATQLDQEGFIACLKKGYQPSACTLGTATDTSGYAVCVNAGYQPSSCDPNGGAGYGACISKGYQPSACSSGSACDTTGYVACVNAGYQPSACNANGGAAYAACIQAGYQPSACSNAVPANITCDPQTKPDQEGYVACIQKGYQPSSCTLGTAIDTSGYATCINAGYQPASCDPNGGAGYGACISKGYQPSACSTGSACDTSGYVACLNAGYQPSACNANGGAAYAACIQAGYQPSACSNGIPANTTCDPLTKPDQEGYVACIRKGYQPSACTLGTATDTSGYAACINQGYQPSSCNPNGGSSYATCILQGYQPSACQ